MQPGLSSESEPSVSTFKHGYEDSDLKPNTSAGHMIDVVL